MKIMCPLVSIGLPVKNGENGLDSAIENLLTADYPNIEIIISDNCSDDRTWDIVTKYTRADARIKAFRQGIRLSASENFNYVLDRSGGKYFLWAAHDDIRSPDYISRAVEFLDANDHAALAYGETVLCYPNGDRSLHDYNFVANSSSPLLRVWRASQSQCYHIYGVWRREFLNSIRFLDCPFWPDLPVMMAAATRGSFEKVDGLVFYRSERIKTNEEILQYGFGVSAREFGKYKLLRVLLRSTYISVGEVSGRGLAIFSTLSVILRFIRQAFSINERYQRRKMAKQGHG